MKKIAILGSTGSVGVQALEIIFNQKKHYVEYLYADSNYKLLYEQVLRFNPPYVCINNEVSYQKLIELIQNTSNIDTEVILGVDNSIQFISSKKVDLIINAIVGTDGLRPTIAAINNNIDIALSNKESLVLAGKIVMEKSKKNNIKIFPVDSEHSAVWQCLRGEDMKDVSKIILTASGGPFRTLDIKCFHEISVEDALNHPNWEMGSKITIDSATMMNKGFELIEAFWLFDIDLDKIEIIVHPESIIHSMVEFKDKSIKAQLGVPEMKVPINYAINYPYHSFLDMESLDLTSISNLTFMKPDLKKFRCIDLAYQAIRHGGSSPAVLNASNDTAVKLFLKNKISFTDIPKIIEDALTYHEHLTSPTLDEIYELISWTENFTYERLLNVNN